VAPYTAVTKPDRTWLVLLRDVSHSVSVRGESRIVTSLVLDMDTGLVLGHAVAATEEDALTQACRTALTQPAGPLPPRRPDNILCAEGLAAPLARALRRLKPATPTAPIVEVGAVDEAEDILDSLIGHLAGRRQSSAFPTAEEWRLLFRQALGFARRQPWARFTDEVDLAVEVRVGGDLTAYAAVVLGHEEVQHGLVLYPGSDVPIGLRSVKPGQRAPTPPGTLMFTLDSPHEPPPEFTAKARRYGWPLEEKLVPVFLTVDGDGPSELGQNDVQRLTVAITAVTRYDRRGLVLLAGSSQAVKGRLTLADTTNASFTIRQLPSTPEESEERLQAHPVRIDLVPDGTPVVMGCTSLEALDSLRHQARVHRPLPASVPAPTGKEVPLIAILANGKRADTIAAKIAKMDPYGVGIIEADQRAIVALVGGEGAKLLMDLPADDDALEMYRSRMSGTQGYHVLIVADDASAHSTGKVFGLYECHLPECSEPTST
jgi:hypothetical protein